MASVTKSITILAAALMAVGCASLDPASSTAKVATHTGLHHHHDAVPTSGWGKPIG